MRSAKYVFAIVVLVALAGAVLAADKPEVTVAGDLQCAKCSMKKAEAKTCQDVLVVAGKDGAPATEYYVVKSASFGKEDHVCKGKKSVVATGTVNEKDGKKWLTVTKISESKS